MRLHFLASTLAHGGAETMAVALSVKLRERGHDVSWSLLRERGTLGERLDAGMNVADTLAPGKLPLSGVRRLRSRFRGAEGLYVLDHQNAVVLGGLAAKWERIPEKVVAIHTTGLWGGRSSLGRPFRSALRFFDHVLALSETHAGYLRDRESVAPEKLAVVSNGIDPEPYISGLSKTEARARVGIEADALVMGTVAMLRPEKNHGLLAESLAALAPDHPRLRALWVGDGPERRRLEALVERLGVADRVSFLGRRDDVADIVPAFDVFALASHPSVETQPVSVIEAMTAGVPVIATKVGDLESMLENGACGVLVEPGDAGAFAEAVRSMLADSETRTLLIERAKTRAGDFTLDAAADALARVLVERVR